MDTFRNVGVCFLCVFFSSWFSWSCSARFVNKVELKKIKERFGGVYQVLEAVDIGNNQVAKIGEKVKLYFISTSESVKVYAYPYADIRESALGNNILYLFEDDFPDTKWDFKFFEEKLKEIVKKIK